MSEIISSIAYSIHGLGVWGYPLATILMAAVAVLPIPAEIPAMLNGMLFGPTAGIAITWTGALLGAQISFELSRRFGRPLVERFLSDSAMARVDGAVQTVSWPALLMARFIPVIAFTALNWGIGLTLCRRRTFFWTTAIGILPGTIVFVSSGEGLARLYARNPGLTAALVLSLAAALLVVARRRRRTGDKRGPSRER